MATGPASGGPPIGQGSPLLLSPVAGLVAVQGSIAQYINNNVYVPSTGDTLTFGNPVSESILVNPGAAITGAILPVGLYDGQEFTIINIAAAINTITFAAVGTSNVAGGVSTVLKGLFGMSFRWSAGQAKWYQMANS